MTKTQAPKIVMIETDKLIPYVMNSRTHSPEQVGQIAASIKEFGFTNPILTDGENGIIAGHGRVMAAQKLELKSVPCIELTGLTAEQKKAYIIADNKLALNAGWDFDVLKSEMAVLQDLDFSIDLLGFTPVELEPLLDGSGLGDSDGASQSNANANGSLAERFMIPPFSVFNAREGWWQNRKSQWIAKGIRSELGRGDNELGFSETENLPSRKGGYGKCLETGIGDKYGREETNGTSIFDPVLCEIAYRWFVPQGGRVIDPFSGGSVRGLVASMLGLQYIGCDLRAEQVEANNHQLDVVPDGMPAPVWICGDSVHIDEHFNGVEADFIFSCPPYADLEVYSDNPLDISSMDYPAFREAYFEIIKKTCSLLRDNRFAAFVVGEVRGKDGNYYNFVGDTIKAFMDAGLNYYNEAILVTAVGTLPIRSGRAFSVSRKLGKTHQNILVFVKGCPRKAVEACGLVEVSDDVFSQFEVGEADGGEYGEQL